MKQEAKEIYGLQLGYQAEEKDLYTCLRRKINDFR